MSGFLFESDFSAVGRRYTIIRPETNKELKFQFASDLVLHYTIHFSGKAYLCPGEEYCPACGTMGKRVLSMIFTGDETHVGMLEVGSPTIASLDGQRRDHSLETLLGTRWSFLRRVPKRPLIPLFTGIAPMDEQKKVSTFAALCGFAKLFSLPLPLEWEDADTFAARTRPALASILAKYLLQ